MLCAPEPPLCSLPRVSALLLMDLFQPIRLKSFLPATGPRCLLFLPLQCLSLINSYSSFRLQFTCLFLPGWVEPPILDALKFTCPFSHHSVPFACVGWIAGPGRRVGSTPGSAGHWAWGAGRSLSFLHLSVLTYKTWTIIVLVVRIK